MPIGSMIGGIISAGGASAAGGTAAAAGSAAAQAAQQQAALYQPWIKPGLNALSTMSGIADENAVNSGDYVRASRGATADYGRTVDEQGRILFQARDAMGLNNFQTSPGYQFRLDQGQNALANSASARGMTLSGAQTKALTDYNQGAASAEYQNWVNNYQNWLGQLGQHVGQYGDYTKQVAGVYGDQARMGNALLGGVADMGFRAQQGQVATNMAGNDYQFRGQNALAGSQADSANALASGVTGATKSAASIFGFGADRGWWW